MDPTTPATGAPGDGSDDPVTQCLRDGYMALLRGDIEQRDRLLARAQALLAGEKTAGEIDLQRRADGSFAVERTNSLRCFQMPGCDRETTPTIEGPIAQSALIRAIGQAGPNVRVECGIGEAPDHQRAPVAVFRVQGVVFGLSASQLEQVIAAGAYLRDLPGFTDRTLDAAQAIIELMRRTQRQLHQATQLQ